MKKSGLVSLVVRVLVVFCLTVCSGEAAFYTNADVAADLIDAARWVGGVAPNWDPPSANILVWDSTLTTPENCTNATGAGTLNIKGIVIRDPAADICVTNNSGTYFGYRPDDSSSGIDMSQAQKDLTIFSTGNTLFFEGSKTSTLSVATGRTLRFVCSGNAVNQRNSIVTIQGPGTVAYSGNWSCAFYNGGAFINLTSGILTNEGDNAMQVGFGGWDGCTGMVTQTGGTFCPSTLQISGDGVGTYNLSNGDLFLRNNLLIGNAQGSVAARGTMNVTGGKIVQLAAAFTVGESSSGSASGNGYGNYFQSGDSVVTAYVFRVANGAKVNGTFSLSNGTFYAAVWDSFAAGSSSTGQIWLAGGRAILPQFPTTRGAGAYADITFDGGTLQPRAASTTYMQGLHHAYLTTNGAVFDTAGFDITITQNLEDYSGHAGSLRKTGSGMLTLAGTNTFTGNLITSNGVLRLTHTECLSTNTTVWISSGATNDLNFTGTNTVYAIYLNGQIIPEGVYGNNNMPTKFSGAGYLRTVYGPFPASVYRFR